ncbi:hypothetical protein BCR44DRAFT_1427161, partial [Catenaria anguillulae PL171]
MRALYNSINLLRTDRTKLSTVFNGARVTTSRIWDIGAAMETPSGLALPSSIPMRSRRLWSRIAMAKSTITCALAALCASSKTATCTCSNANPLFSSPNSATTLPGVATAIREKCRRVWRRARGTVGTRRATEMTVLPMPVGIEMMKLPGETTRSARACCGWLAALGPPGMAGDSSGWSE